MKMKSTFLIVLAAALMVFSWTIAGAQHRRFKNPGAIPPPERRSTVPETDSPDTQTSSTAQQAEAISTVEPIVGSWEAHFISVERPLPYPPIKTLLTFTADGGVVEVDGTAVPFSDGEKLLAISPGHGVWRKVKNRVYEVKIVQLLNDNEGNYLQKGVITARIRVNFPGDGFSGKDTFQAFFPDGTPVPDAHAEESFRGRRIEF